MPLLAYAVIPFVAWLGSAIAQPADGPAQASRAGYVGAAACRECHAAESDAWARSRHRQSMQVADATAVRGDFRNAKFAYAGTTSTFFARDGKYFVRTDGPGGKLAEFEIRYTFGVDPLQQYLIALPGGRLQALGIAWDTRPKKEGGQRWFHLYPGRNVKAGDPLHWTGIDQNWNFMCAECHSTALDKKYDRQRDRFDTTYAEIDVACEACHGPGADHATWAKAKRDGKPYAGSGLAIALDERKGVAWSINAATGTAQRSAQRTTSREIDTCARCHARAGRIADGYVHGRPPLDTHRLVLLDDGLYYPDGQMRDEVYEWGSFVQSRMHAKGVTCSDCHDPHAGGLKQPGNDVCGQCHAPSRFDAPTHTRHAKGSRGSACTDCHMPTTTYMVLDARHDHSLRIPRPDLSAALGTPNACTGCHARQTPQWAADAIARWTGRAPTGFQDFGAALAAGNSGAPGARGMLMKVVDDTGEPSIARASALARLGGMLTPASLGTVTRALNDPEALVRLAAVDALSNADAATRVRYLPRMLADPVKSVRIDAARALAGPSEGQIPAADRDAFAKALDEYVAVQRYNADRPEGRMNLGNLYATRGDAVRAVAEFESALAVDPTFFAASVNLADVHRARGDDAAAETVLRAAISTSPRAAALHNALGLALVRQKRGAEALRELGEAARLAPEDAHYAYVYAVALADAGRPREALAVLASALKRHPWDREVLLGLAHYSAGAGDREAARRYAKTLTELDPENREYARLAASFAAPR
jgi:tetratricopeptide (TPR) repeat protein